MKRLLLLITSVFFIVRVYGQGTPVGDPNSPIYHYNGNVGVGLTNPQYGLDILKTSEGQETLFRARITDASEDYFKIFNATYSSGQLIPSLVGFHNSDTRSCLYFTAITDSQRDSGLSPLMIFDSRTNSGQIQKRPLFGWESYGERKMTLNVNGNLGIGTSTPLEKLEVNGSLLIKGNNLDGEDLSYLDGSAKFLIGWNRSRGLGETNFISNRGAGSEGGFDFRNYNNGGTESVLVRMKGNGNVGIGTTTPDYKLDVLGTIRASEVKVATGWSDFVFEPNYDLPSLQEVENYIEQNGHLPDIPSAEEVKADGISLGEMDAKLLQKIEELTLYIIGQQRIIQTQNERISELEKILK